MLGGIEMQPPDCAHVEDILGLGGLLHSPAATLSHIVCWNGCDSCSYPASTNSWGNLIPSTSSAYAQLT